MFALNGLPMPYHPLFNSDKFGHGDPRPVLPLHRGGRSHFDMEGTRVPVEPKPVSISEVPH